MSPEFISWEIIPQCNAKALSGGPLKGGQVRRSPLLRVIAGED